jgi:hypothetical protein
MALYLLCAILGLFIPWYFNLQHLLYSPIPFSISEYFRQGTATPLAASITYDFFIGTTPALVWMLIECRRLKMKYMWLYLFGTFAIAFAFTFPLFLFNRERKLRSGRQNTEII